MPEPVAPSLPSRTQEDGGTCKPGQRADLTGCVPVHPSVSKNPKAGASTRSNTEKKTSKISFSGKQRIGRVDSDDWHGIEEAMTDSEQEEFVQHMDQARSDWVDAVIQDYKPEIDEDELATENGYDTDSVRGAVRDMVEEMPDGDLKNELLLTVESTTLRKAGTYGIDVLRDRLRVADAPEELIKELDEYYQSVDEELTERRQEAEDRDREHYAEDVSSE